MKSDNGRRVERRRARFHLREALAAVTERPRVALCGRAPLRDPERPRLPIEPQVRLGSDDDPAAGIAHFARVQLCGAVWVCPVCGPRIRQVRSVDLDAACHRWMATHGAGSLHLLTLTVPHDYGEPLPVVMASVRSAYSQLVAGRAWADDKRLYGLRHYVRAHDVTYGRAGWHPHIHAVLFSEGAIEPGAYAQLERRLAGRWARSVAGFGRRRPERAYGVQLETARRMEDVTNYVYQVVRQTGDDGYAQPVSMEVTRGDLKTANPGQLTPWQVLERTTDPADSAYYTARWLEWEAATQGVHAIRWSKGLRAAVGLTAAEQADSDIVAVEVGGRVVYTFPGWEWRRVRNVPGLLARVLEAAEVDGGAGVAGVLCAEAGRRIVVASLDTGAVDDSRARESHSGRLPRSYGRGAARQTTLPLWSMPHECPPPCHESEPGSDVRPSR